jgi:hypothetical protein
MAVLSFDFSWSMDRPPLSYRSPKEEPMSGHIKIPADFTERLLRTGGFPSLFDTATKRTAHADFEWQAFLPRRRWWWKLWTWFRRKRAAPISCEVGDTVTIGGVTFTAAAAQSLPDREFDQSGTDTQCATSIAACVNDATYGVTGVTATSAAAIVSLTRATAGTKNTMSSSNGTRLALLSVSMAESRDGLRNTEKGGGCERREDGTANTN